MTGPRRVRLPVTIRERSVTIGNVTHLADFSVRSSGGSSMNNREMALHEMGNAAADAVMRLERVKGWLDDLTPPEAQAWFRARQACDFLYVAVKLLTSGMPPQELACIIDDIIEEVIDKPPD